MSTQNTLLRDTILGNEAKEANEKLSVEKMLDRYEASGHKYNLFIKKINISQEQKALVRDYEKARAVQMALEQIKQIVSQGRSTKVDAPDDSDYGKQLSILEKLAASLTGWLGLSSTGMSQESAEGLSVEQRQDNLLHSLSLGATKIKAALESVQGDIDPDILASIERNDPKPNYFEVDDPSKTL